jgi:hypothetical protein
MLTQHGRPGFSILNGAASLEPLRFALAIPGESGILNMK